MADRRTDKRNCYRPIYQYLALYSYDLVTRYKKESSITVDLRFVIHTYRISSRLDRNDIVCLLNASLKSRDIAMSNGTRNFRRYVLYSPEGSVESRLN